jgi:hypothetical protein
MEDIRNGRKTRAKRTLITMAAAIGQLPANADRVGVFFSEPGNTTVIAALTRDDAVSSTGYPFPGGGVNRILRVEEAGQFVTGDIWVGCAAGSVLAIEFILEKE